MDFMAACKNINANKPCTIKFCHECLQNRYGEKAEEVVNLEEWICPKCRGICNCSFCIKKRLHQSTGNLVYSVKAAGFSSVSDVLHVQGFENVDSLKEKYTSRKKPVGEMNGVSSPVKRRKENCLDGHSDVSLSPKNVNVNEKPKKAKRVGLKEMHGMNGNGDAILKNTMSKKTKISQGASKLEGMADKNDDTMFVGNDGENIPYCKKIEGDHKVLRDAVRNGVCNGNAEVKKKAAIKSCTAKDTVTVQKKFICEEIQLPQGAELTNVAGVDVPTEDVGHALQFLEFCATFGKVLDVKRGEPGSVLRDLFCCRSTRSGKCSSNLQFQIKLLKVILGLDEDEEFTSSTTTSGGNAWLEALKECVSESQSILKDLPEDCFDNEDRYNRLDSSKKLKVLTFLCDETLGTGKLRNWIAEQNDVFAEEKKQARGKLAAKEKEKHVKRKMQDEIARAILAKNGDPLTISEHEAIILEIKNEAANAHAEVLEARGMAPGVYHQEAMHVHRKGAYEMDD
ncbi:Zinc-finger domain of monoamine-oxidase A repressor R1, partial [Dillenia turbinata]